MPEEREHVTFFEFARWVLPTLLVLIGVIFYLLYADSAPAIGSAIPLP